MYQKSDGAFGLQPKKTTVRSWANGGSVALPWKGELDTADRRLRELEELFKEDGEAADGEESLAGPYPWRKPL